MTLICDNQIALHIALFCVHEMIKQNEIDYHFIREKKSDLETSSLILLIQMIN